MTDALNMLPPSRYSYRLQKPYCCVPACLQMVLERRELTVLDQERIGAELGLIIPESAQKLLPQTRVGPKPISGYGTRVQLPEFSINSFFDRCEIPLQERYIRASKLTNLEAIITAELLNQNDILVCFHEGIASSKKDRDWGHVCLINSVQGDTIELVDPEKTTSSYRVVKEQQLFGAVKHHGDERRGGIWIISDSSFVHS